MEILTRHEVKNPNLYWGNVVEDYHTLIFNGRHLQLKIKTVILCMDAYMSLLRSLYSDGYASAVVATDSHDPVITLRGTDFIGSPCQKTGYATIYATPIGGYMRAIDAEIMENIKMITINDKDHG